MFNSDQLQSFVRAALVAGGTWVVAHFGLDAVGYQAVVADFAGGLSVLVGIVWAQVFHAGATKDKLEKVVVEAVVPQTPEEAKVVEKAAKAQGVA